MSANVRCAGGGDTTAPPFDHDGDPCGWRGKRLGWFTAYMFPTETSEQLEERVSTAKACPRCRGGVEMIPRPAVDRGRP